MTKHRSRKQSSLSFSSSNSSQEGDDEQLARDLQLAYELQDQEDEQASALVRRRQNQQDNHHTAAMENGFVPNAAGLNADHMLFVHCEMDGRAMELLVDSGASASAMSSQMVDRLGLRHKLNTNVFGAAKGVGSSKIVGLVEHVACQIGHVEFRLYFMVIEGNMPYCILGLDQMRRFKCQIDLDENVLVFGGKEGVQVPFLSQPEAQRAAMKMLEGTVEQQGAGGWPGARKKGFFGM